MKLFQILLSSPETTVEIHQRLADGRAVRVPTKLRNIELEILDGCYMALSGNCQNVNEYLQCLRIMDQFQHLPDNVKSVKLTQPDLENLFNGFRLTTGKRPESWTRAKALFESLNAPVEVQDDKTNLGTVKKEEPKVEEICQ
jgi:hypothetical protein